jgi:hypothetical protein
LLFEEGSNSVGGFGSAMLYSRTWRRMWLGRSTNGAAEDYFSNTPTSALRLDTFNLKNRRRRLLNVALIINAGMPDPHVAIVG